MSANCDALPTAVCLVASGHSGEKAKKEAKPALAQHGLLRKGSEAKSTELKIPSSDQLTATKGDPAQLEINIRRKMSTKDWMEDKRYISSLPLRGPFINCAPKKLMRLVGVGNQEKVLAALEAISAKRAKAKRAKIARSQQKKKIQKQR